MAIARGSEVTRRGLKGLPLRRLLLFSDSPGAPAFHFHAACLDLAWTFAWTLLVAAVDDPGTRSPGRYESHIRSQGMPRRPVTRSLLCHARLCRVNEGVDEGGGGPASHI